MPHNTPRISLEWQKLTSRGVKTIYYTQVRLVVESFAYHLSPLSISSYELRDAGKLDERP